MPGDAMHWKEQAAQLDREGNFDITVFLLEKTIKENPDNVDAYLMLLYRLMDSIVNNAYYWSNVSDDPLKGIKEEYYHLKASQEYRPLLQKYFDESYAKFSENPEYLFYASRILMAQYWFCGLRVSDDFLGAMQQKAFGMGYNSLLARSEECRKLSQQEPHNPQVIAYARQLLTDPSLQDQLRSKGSIAQYAFGSDIAWAQKIGSHSAT